MPTIKTRFWNLYFLSIKYFPSSLVFKTVYCFITSFLEKWWGTGRILRERTMCLNDFKYATTMIFSYCFLMHPFNSYFLLEIVTSICYRFLVFSFLIFLFLKEEKSYYHSIKVRPNLVVLQCYSLFILVWCQCFELSSHWPHLDWGLVIITTWCLIAGYIFFTYRWMSFPCHRVIHLHFMPVSSPSMQPLFEWIENRLKKMCQWRISFYG